MKSSRKTILLILSVLAVLPCIAQNNKYKIDDTCYPLFRTADSLLGNESVIPIIDRLQSQAEAVQDDKAFTLASVLRLRHSIRCGQDREILAYFNELKDISLRTGYLQYYFYAYQLVSVHYFNLGQKTRGLEYAVKMHDDAVAMDNDYGKWSSAKHLAELYWAHYERDAARKCFEEAVETYNNTTDETIRVQSMSKVYVNLAFTYGFDSPEYEECVRKALETSKIAFDTVLVNYCKACNAAVRKDLPAYHVYRNRCTESSFFPRVRMTGAKVIRLTDNALGGDWDAVRNDLANLERLEDLLFVSQLAASYGKLQIVNDCYDCITKRLIISYKDQMTRTLSETEVMLENEALNQSVIEQKTMVNRVMLALILFIIVVVFLIGIITEMYIGNLKRAKNDADAANRMKTHFVQNISHEIRTPLNAVVGYSQLLAMPDVALTDDEKSEFASYITNNSSMLMMLIDDILDLSDIDSGNYRLIIGDCNCNEICRMAMKTVECRIPPEVEFSFVTDVSEDLTVKSDERRVQQIIINYLTNSCKHTVEGKITLACTLGAKPGYVTFSVSDTGTGIPQEDAEKIFQRFSKLDKFKQGSGLGLNICKVLSEKLGGIVELDLTYGRCSLKSDRGARFLFHLPLNGPADNQG